ncbi:MAG: O-methyltransferase [Reichenbachiella sp.]
MEFIDKKIQSYSEEHTSAPSDLLKRIDRETHLQVLRPRMLSGRMQGRILSMLSHMIKPEFILEIGSYTGYSALCLAEGLAIGGRLVTIDVNEELADRVNGYISESNYSEQIQFRSGDALELIPSISEKIDLVFIDADKLNYQQYFELVIDKMNKGGYIIADNVLWSGKVVEEVKKTDKDTLALLDFNQRMHEDSRVENVLLPVRDGLMILRVL